MIIAVDAQVPAGQFADLLPGARVIRFYEGELLPPLAEMSHLIVLGGNTNAYDPALAPVAALLRQATENSVPTLGVCLGAQLLAITHGGRVTVGAPSGPERGIVTMRLRPDAAADPVLGAVVAALGRDVKVASMHADAVTTLPEGAVWLGSSPVYPFQAFRVGSALGVQFHPEVEAPVFGEWLAAETGADPAVGREEWYAHGDQLREVAALIIAGLTAAPRPEQDQPVREHAELPGA